MHGPGVGSLLNRIEREQLANLRVIRHDAVEVLEQMVGDGALAAIHLFFPDPWPKKRHHKRRLVQPEFAALAARKLAPGGILHAATDWPDYAEHMQRSVFEGAAARAGDRRGFVERPVTKFESRGPATSGHPIRRAFISAETKSPSSSLRKRRPRSVGRMRFSRARSRPCRFASASAVLNRDERQSGALAEERDAGNRRPAAARSA